MNRIKNIWKCFEEKHSAIAKWLYQIFYFVIFSMGVTVFPVSYTHLVTAAAIMAAAIFAFSNLSFLNENAPFASKERADIFSIRTLIDFGGIAILHAYQSRISEYVTEKELSVMNVMLKSQYEQYRNYQDSLDLIQMKYHDLKHQITGLRAESDEEKRKKWIDSMEKEIAAFENISRTGNQVLDTILAAKIFHCRKNHIQITCVADGKLLDYMHVTDICSIFGNALDNAIEHAILIPNPEKRLIHLTVSAQKGFVSVSYTHLDVYKRQGSGKGTGRKTGYPVLWEKDSGNVNSSASSGR